MRFGVRQLFLTAIGIAALAAAISPVTDPDFFWHMRVGQHILETATIPTRDLFTYTVSSHRFVAHEWLSEVIMSSLSRGLGLWAVVLFFGLLTWAGFLVLLATPRDVSFVVRGLALALGIAAGNAIWGPRTQMITFAFVVFLLYLLRRWRADLDRRWLYPIPPLFILWVNLHAGFTIGLIFLVVYAVGEAITRAAARQPVGPALRPLLLTTAGAVVLAAVNPNGPLIYPYAVATQFSPAQQRLIVEWFSPDFHQYTQVGAYEVMLLLVPVLLALGGRRPRFTDLLLLLAGMTLSLQSVRHIALFVAVATPVVAEIAEGIVERARTAGLRLREPRTTPVTAAINVVVAVLVVLVLLVVKVPDLRQTTTTQAVRSQFPVAALDALGTDLPPGNVFNAYGWGGYFVYRLYPSRRVYIYGDAAVMGDPFLTEYESVENLHSDYLQVLDRRGVTWVLDRSDAPLVSVLRNSTDWATVYRDNLATVLVRRTGATRTYLARHPG